MPLIVTFPEPLSLRVILALADFLLPVGRREREREKKME